MHLFACLAFFLSALSARRLMYVYISSGCDAGLSLSLYVSFSPTIVTNHSVLVAPTSTDIPTSSPAFFSFCSSFLILRSATLAVMFLFLVFLSDSVCYSQRKRLCALSQQLSWSPPQCLEGPDSRGFITYDTKYRSRRYAGLPFYNLFYMFTFFNI